MSCGRWAAILLIAGTLVAPLAAVAVWARNQMLDTDAYIRTVAPLAADAAIRRAVADRGMEKIAGAGAQPVVQREARQVVDEVLASAVFAAAWKHANRIAHDQVVMR